MRLAVSTISYGAPQSEFNDKIGWAGFETCLIVAEQKKSRSGSPERDEFGSCQQPAANLPQAF
jgi:hypothetical protein